MSASGPVHDGPNQHEPLEELFGCVFDLAGQIASRISPDEVEARLTRTLRAAEEESVTALVTRAAAGDSGAWNRIIDRYAPLVYAICARYRLSQHDIEDVGQRVWMLLVEQIGNLREPAALPGWLATTTARECLRVVTAARRSGSLAADLAPPVADDAEIDAQILAAEQDATLRAAFAGLPARCQQLLSMLASDPPHSYAEISAALEIPIGSIGPQRARCLNRLRRSLAVTTAVGAEEPDSMSSRPPWTPPPPS
jgi:RNA polymerase sigma factor (sigma-70 family)